MKTFLVLASFLVFSCASLSTRALAVDLKQVEKELNGAGATGWIHGAVPGQGLYVFTYRNPDNFFDYVEMSLVSEDAAIQQQLAGFSRNDQVLVRGAFLPNPSPQKHVHVNSISLVKKYANPYEKDAYRYHAEIPADLGESGRATFLVHAVAGDGKILVLEYKDAVVPVFVTKPELTKDLARNDMIELSYKRQSYPNQPAHLNLDTSVAEPLKVVESIRSHHGQPAVLDGALVMFPKSPEIIFNVFAVQQELTAGLSRQYTLVNFKDGPTFQKIRAKLQAEWDKFPGQYVNGRNKLVSTKIRVRATGSYNDVDPGQANPQILLDSPDSIELYEK